MPRERDHTHPIDFSWDHLKTPREGTDMIDQPPDETTDNERTPRWVVVFFTIAVIVIVAFLIVLFVGDGHSPGRHGL